MKKKDEGVRLCHVQGGGRGDRIEGQIEVQAQWIVPGWMWLPMVFGEVDMRDQDVRVFNPFAPSNSNINLDKCFAKHEREKIRVYEQWVREVEHASFVPLVMSVTGGLAKHATTFYKHLASLLADKWEQLYSTTLYWLRCSLSFSLLRSAFQCVCGACSSKGHLVKLTPVDLVTAEASLQHV